MLHFVHIYLLCAEAVEKRPAAKVTLCESVAFKSNSSWLMWLSETPHYSFNFKCSNVHRLEAWRMSDDSAISTYPAHLEEARYKPLRPTGRQSVIWSMDVMVTVSITLPTCQWYQKKKEKAVIVIVLLRALNIWMCVLRASRQLAPSLPLSACVIPPPLPLLYTKLCQSCYAVRNGLGWGLGCWEYSVLLVSGSLFLMTPVRYRDSHWSSGSYTRLCHE